MHLFGALAWVAHHSNESENHHMYVIHGCLKPANSTSTDLEYPRGLGSTYVPYMSTSRLAKTIPSAKKRPNRII
jgi:hypothetical protein